MQTEKKKREVLKGNIQSSWGNGSYYRGNFTDRQPHLSEPDNDTQGQALCGVYHDYQQLSLSPRSK